MALRDEIGKRVKEWRKKSNLSQEDLAGKVGRSVEAVSLIERGINLPSLETIEEIAKALQIPVYEFYREAGVGSDKQQLIDKIIAMLYKMEVNTLKVVAKQIEALEG